MSSTPRSITLLRLVLGGAALAFGWLLLSMTQAYADDGTPLTTVEQAVVAELPAPTPVPKTADVVEPVKATAKTVVKVAAPVLAAPVTSATAVVRTTTTAVSEGIDSTVSTTLDEVPAVISDALPTPAARPDVPVVPRPTTAGARPATTPAATPATVATEDAVSRAHAARELASQARHTDAIGRLTAATTSSSARSGSLATVPHPVSRVFPVPEAPAAVALPTPTAASGGGPRSVDAAAVSSAAASSRTTPLRADGAWLRPVPGPVSDPGSRPD
jgi:hypothetical protein